MAAHSGVVPAEVELDGDLLEIVSVIPVLWEDKLRSDKEGQDSGQSEGCQAHGFLVLVPVG